MRKDAVKLCNVIIVVIVTCCCFLSDLFSWRNPASYENLKNGDGGLFVHRVEWSAALDQQAHLSERAL